MPPVSGTPRELLWYHQIQRENRHLLEQIGKQQAELDKIKNKSSADQGQREQTQQLLMELETRQATVTERRREGFEREKEILKRVGKLEESIEMLRKANDSQPVVTGAISQCHALEQRLGVLEQHRIRAPEHDLEQLNLRIDALARVVNSFSKNSTISVEQHTNHESDKEPRAEDDTDARKTNAGKQVRREPSSGELHIQREMSSERRSDFVQKKRRPGEKHIPFRPTPPDLGW
jgi:chromosome segregation ATPase